MSMLGERPERIVLVISGFLTDVLQGGLLFGWAALSEALTELGEFRERCDEPTGHRCIEQQEALEFIWTLGVASVNFSPVIIGPVLDIFGPKITAIVGTLINAASLALLAVADSSHFNVYPLAAVGLGLGGVAYHLSQFHKGDLYPRSKGVITSTFNAGFSLSACMLPLVLAVAHHSQTGPLTRNAFRSAMATYALVLLCVLPWLAWKEPKHPTRILVATASSMDDTTSEPLLRSYTSGSISLADAAHRISTAVPPPTGVGERPSALADGVFDKRAGSMDAMPVPFSCGSRNMMATLLSGCSSSASTPTASSPNDYAHSALAAGVPPSVVCAITTSLEPSQCPQHPQQQQQQQQEVDLAAFAHHTASSPPHDAGRRHGSLDSPSSRITRHEQWQRVAALRDNASLVESLRDYLPLGNSGPPSHINMTFLDRLSPRWLRLREASLYMQLTSWECVGTCAWYSISVVMLQFYLGTAPEQLRLKGDTSGVMADLVSPIVGLGFVAVPSIGYLLDQRGYGETFIVITLGGIACSLLQAVPWLPAQLLTLITWSLDRFCLYAAFYTIVGSLFGFKHFGRIVAFKSAISGAISFLQYPVHNFVEEHLRGRFWIVSLLQALIGVLMLPFCVLMLHWEHSR